MSEDQNPLRREGLLRFGAVLGDRRARVRRGAPFLAANALAGADRSGGAHGPDHRRSADRALAALAALRPVGAADHVFLVVALLIQTSSGGPSGYVPLALLPIFWLALRHPLGAAIAMVAAFSMFVARLLFLQDRAYSQSDLRAALLWMAISLVVGFTAQMFQRGNVPTATFHQEKIRKYTDGQIFDVITNGVGLMPAYQMADPSCGQVGDHRPRARVAARAARTRRECARLR